MKVIYWKSAGVVERDGLENRYMGFYIEGSNPSSSAIYTKLTFISPKCHRLKSPAFAEFLLFSTNLLSI